jgi:subfamily B ATP-binding cassette protein MsbA
MAALALLSAMLEGVSLTLVIPLVQALSESAASSSPGGFLALLQGTVSTIPIEARLLVILAAIFLAVFAKSVVSYANFAVLGVIYGRLSHGLRSAVFARIMGIPLAKIERERAGKLLNVLNNETWRAADALNVLFTVVTSLTTVAVFLVILVLLSWKLSLIAVLCMAFLLPLIHVISLRTKKMSDLGLAANESLAQQTWSALNGLRTIHSFGRENFEVRRFNAASDQVRDLFLRMAFVSMASGPATEILVTAVVGLLVIFVHASHVGMSVLVGFLAILYRLQPRLVAIVSAQSKLLGLHASVGAVSEVLDSTAAPERGGAGRRFSHLRDAVLFKDVTFTYPGASRPALIDLSFAIRRGTIVAVAGFSGAGKSTLLDLLLRFQRPQRGSIMVDGVPLEDIAPTDWRDRIGVVSQDPYVFDDTVRANIMFGRSEASESEMVEAARFAGADEFIRALPMGYDTRVGERGIQISGGQRQRIALARALLRDPDILLLDEATNALDSITERAFQQTLRRFAESRAVIIVAHRLSTVLNADLALVLKDGRIVEQGRPGCLLEASGLFARMFSAPVPNAVDIRGSGACVS